MCLAQDTGLYLCCQFHAQFRFVLAWFKFHFFVLWLSILLKFIWYGHHHPRHVLVASNRPPFVLIRPYIRIRATLLRIAATYWSPRNELITQPHRVLCHVGVAKSPSRMWNVSVGFVASVVVSIVTSSFCHTIMVEFGPTILEWRAPSFKSRLTVYIDYMMEDVVSGSPIRLWMFPAGFGVKRRATHGRNVAHQTAL